MRRMARTILAAVGVAWGAGAWGALAPRPRCVGGEDDRVGVPHLLGV